MEALILLGVVVICLLVLARLATANSHQNPSTHGRRLNTANAIELHYDTLGTRLRQIGNVKINYDGWGTRPKWLGTMELHYDTLGTRLRQIGNVAIDYDSWGTRVRQVGNLKINYDSWGTRPKYVALNNYLNLDEDTLITLFFVLYERTRRERANNS